jgi:hypothetical protein
VRAPALLEATKDLPIALVEQAVAGDDSVDRKRKYRADLQSESRTSERRPARANHNPTTSLARGAPKNAESCAPSAHHRLAMLH